MSKNPLVSANISHTKAYFIPHQCIFNEKFTELHRLHMADLIEGDNLVWMSLLFNNSTWYNSMHIKIGFSKIGFSHPNKVAISNLKSPWESP